VVLFSEDVLLPWYQAQKMARYLTKSGGGPLAASAFTLAVNYNY
jgi:hypothetical protein